MFLDDELITATYPNWLFGPDNSGDIFKWTAEYVNSVAAKSGKYHLITADGSSYCQVSFHIVTFDYLSAHLLIGWRLFKIFWHSFLLSTVIKYCFIDVDDVVCNLDDVRGFKFVTVGSTLSRFF